MIKPVYFAPLFAFGIMLAACQPAQNVPKSDPSPPAAQIASTTPTNANQNTLQPISQISATAPIASSTLNTNGKIAIDWQKIDSAEAVVDKQKFAYTFAPNSIPVQNYVKAYKVDATTAQYNLTIGMAANELLSKVLDQIGTSYVSHELTAGSDSKLIIHTTAKVVPSEHAYVLAEPFAKGLVLPVQLIADGKKP